MSESIHPENESNATWPTQAVARLRVPNTSMLPGSEKPPSPAVRRLKRAVQRAHEAVDRLAGRAAPVARRLGDGVSSAEAALETRAGLLRDTREDWVQGVRTTVRQNPLVSLAAALALGAVIARITR